MTTPEVASTRRRPRDRRQQIVTRAGALFHQYGFGNVGTSDIAQAVGITPGALYRHFPSKSDILKQAVDEVIDDSLLSAGSRAGSLEGLIDALCEALRERRSLGILWHREVRHLAATDRDDVQHRLAGFLQRIATELASLSPELEESESHLRAWFVLSVLTSSSYHTAELPPDKETALLRQCAIEAATAPIDRPDHHSHGSQAVSSRGITHQSRRESVVGAAAQLFFERGYQATAMEDIGTAVGMSGAAVYKYFPSKADVLAATIARGSEPLHLGLARALGSAGTVEEALVLALDEYIDFATVHHHLVGILVSEVTNLPNQLRHNVRRQQADYVAEWVRLLRESRTELGPAEARYIIQAMLTIINDATRVDDLLQYPHLSEHLRQVGRRLLTVEL